MLNVQFMPNNYGFKAIVKVKYNVLNYPEIKPLRIITSKVIKLFLKKYIFYKHKIPIKLKVNNSSENKKKVIETYNKLIITQIIRPAYNPRSQGLIEKKYVPITKALIKKINGIGKK